MNEYYSNLALDRKQARSRTRRLRSERAGQYRTEDGFPCKHCHAYVSSAPFLSGVWNRNHCPYCLWSRHLDCYQAGDRLSACKALMRPIGLTIKMTRKKYGPGRGELMLIHLCVECDRLSINRVAADDDPQTVFGVYENYHQLDALIKTRLRDGGIEVLASADSGAVQAQLFGFG